MLIFLYIFTHDPLWLVIPSLNLIVSCLHVSYYLYLHTFMLFRSTCLWLFSVDNPLRVATEALNIHLVSCILSFIETEDGSVYKFTSKLPLHSVATQDKITMKRNQST